MISVVIFIERHHMTKAPQYPKKLDPMDDNPEQRTASKSLDNDESPAVGVGLTDQLTLKVIEQRNYFQQYIYAHYLEIVINLRNYKNLPRSINQYKLEWYLRNNYDVVIGKNSLGYDTIMGIVYNKNTTTDPASPFAMYGLNKHSIQWTVPKAMIPDLDFYSEILPDDNATTGEFVVLRNKPVTYTSDFKIIETYSHRLAEIQASRYSLILQAKISKILQGEPTNNTLNEIIDNLYNGAPFIKTTEFFIPSRDILDMSNDHISDSMRALKQEYNDQLGELNNLLGINSTGIDKASGVTESEVNSNNDLVTSVGNMYINGVQYGLDLYNKRYGTNIQAYLNQKSERVGLADETDNKAN